MKMRMDKSMPRYVDNPIPENRKSYTRDFREVRLKGVSFAAPNLLTIVPSQYDNPKSPYEALANFFFVARTGEVLVDSDDGVTPEVGPFKEWGLHP